MFGHVEDAYAVIRAERQLADLRATKLGPLLAEAERGSAEATTRNNAAPLVITWLRRLIQRRRLAWLASVSFRASQGRAGGLMPVLPATESKMVRFTADRWVE